MAEDARTAGGAGDPSGEDSSAHSARVRKTGAENADGGNTDRANTDPANADIASTAAHGSDTSGTADASSEPAGVDDPGVREPDYRFTLANERTFLAYVRTALALDAASVAAMQFLTAVEDLRIRRLISSVLAVAGIAASIGAYVRWRANVAAMRRDAPLPPTLMPLGLAASALVVSLAVIALVVFG
ncbi:DUF202 domain-containing protein [Actinopolymorpha sp. B9G3]|uniref:YidH family protein n=1 Tax=Actinopolymorpha sp. B9G3 TaxID=3158970 RepID=UPI0032D8F0FA